MNMCERCRIREATILVTDDWQEHLCNTCFNEIVSNEIEIQLEPIPEKIKVTDHAGSTRNFTITQKLYPHGIFLEAIEKTEYGYQFSVHGELECNQSELFQKLIDKVKCNVSNRFTKIGEFPDCRSYQAIIEDEVVGRIDHDEMNPFFPMVVIDGQPFTWEELGEMVKRFEGYQVQMKFYDPTDDVK